MKIFNKVPAFFALVAISSLLFSCEPIQTIHVSSADNSPIVCAENAEMSYLVLTKWNNGTVTKDESRVTGTPNPLSVNPDHPMISFMGDGVADIDYIQFVIFCADEPLIVTPEIKPEDLIKMDEKNYHYFVAE